MSQRIFNATVRVVLSETDEQIMQNAAELGRRTGRDHDWFPADLNEAVLEIIMFSDAPTEDGVEI